MPGLLKVGFTERSVEERAKELNSSTGVPAAFRIEAYFAAEDPALEESKVHKALENCRKPGKEFFVIAVSEAIERIGAVIQRRPIFLAPDAGSED